MLVELARGERIGLRERAGGKNQFQIADPFHQRVAPTEHPKALAPDNVAALLVDVLDHAGDKWKAVMQRIRQRFALWQRLVTRHQRDTQFFARETVTEIQIAHIAAVVTLIVGRDAKLDK